MKKSLILLLCLLMMGVVDADAQKRRTKRVVKTQQTVRKKQKQPVDSAVIFAYWDEHGVVWPHYGQKRVIIGKKQVISLLHEYF